LDTHTRPDAIRASFEYSLLPMLVADDQRRYVDANRAACLLLRLSRVRVLELTIDDLTPLENRAPLQALWEEFLKDGTQVGLFELMMPDGGRVAVEYSATANMTPGRHVAILDFPPRESAHPAVAKVRTAPEAPLSNREREVLARVAAGQTSEAIANALKISVATVETHVRRCLAKLAAKNRAHAIALAIKRGEIALMASALFSLPAWS
jgi:PAS domain S-box-containing protein